MVFRHGFSTIVMVFLRSPELTKIVLPKVLQNFQKMPKCTCWPKELNQKGFPRNIQYQTRPKGSFFLALCVFFQKNFFPTNGPPSIVLKFCNKMDVEKSQRVLPFSFFRHCEAFFLFFHKSSPNSPILGNFVVLLLFLSLGYGADLGRSRHVFEHLLKVTGQLGVIKHLYVTAPSSTAKSLVTLLEFGIVQKFCEKFPIRCVTWH